MAFEYGINAKLNVEGALTNVEKLIKKLEAAEEKAAGLKVNVTINNELAQQLKGLKDISNAQKQVVANTAKQAQDQERLNALEEKTAGIKKKNADDALVREQKLAQAKNDTAAKEKKNADDAIARQQKLANQKKTDDDNALQRAEKLRTQEQKTATEAAKTANEIKKGQDAAAAAEQKLNAARQKSSIDNATSAQKYAEATIRGEQHIQQENEKTKQSILGTFSSAITLASKYYSFRRRQQEDERKDQERAWREKERQQKAQKANDDAIARDLEKQARFEQVEVEIAEQRNAKTKELADAIRANQKAEADYQRILAKELPTLNEIRAVRERLDATRSARQTAEYRANSPLSFLVGKVGPEGSWTNKLQRLGGGLSKAGEVLQGATQAYQAVQEVAENTTSSIWGVARSFFNQVSNSFSNLTQEGLEAFGTLEMAEIGFANFFDGSATEFTQKIKERAVEMPMVGAADLARSVQYIAPLAGGNSDLALSAVEGVMKSIVYSGNDVSQYGTKALQNLTQVASGNLTATDIKEMMRQMPALPRLLASTDTGSELLEGGQITTKAVKNYIAKYGSDAILGVFKEISEKSEASDIYKTANQTFKGAVEQLQEKMVLEWQNVFQQSGAANVIKDILNELSKDGGIIEKVGERVAHYGRIIVDWFKKNEKEINEVLNAVGEGLGEIATQAKDIAMELLQSLEVVDGNGKINTAKFKELISQVMGFIKGIVSGFGSGLKSLLGMLDTLRKNFGPEIFENIGHAIGLLASPMGNFITMLGRMGSNLLRAAGGIVTLMSGMTGKEIWNKAITKTGEWATNLGLTSATGNVPKAIGNAAYSISGGRLSSVGVASGVSKVATFAGKAVKGAGITALGLGLTEAAKGLADIAFQSKEVTSAVGGLGTGLTLAAAGFSVFGPAGAVIGGILGAVTGFVTEMKRQEEKLHQENVKKANDEIQQLLNNEGGQSIKNITDTIFTMLEENGVDIDRGSDSGKYAEQMVIKEIDKLLYDRNDEGKITAVHAERVMDAMKNGDLSKLAAGWYRDKETMEKVANLTTTEQFLKAGGNYVDFEKDTKTRDELAEFIKRNWQNGDPTEYDYENRSAESIVRDYLQTIAPNGQASITDKQIELLYKTEQDKLAELSPLTSMAENVNGMQEAVDAIDWEDVSKVTTTLNANGMAIYRELYGLNTSVAAIREKLGVKGDETTTYSGAGFLTTEQSDRVSEWTKKGKGGMLGGGTKSGLYTQTDGSKDYYYNGGVFDSPREKLAEVYGKKDPKNTDDMSETLAKMQEVSNKILDKMLDPNVSSTAMATLQEDLEVLESWKKALLELEAGDWGGLFNYQRAMEIKFKEPYGLQFRAAGGLLKALLGRGRGVDTVPAFLQPGEFVMRKSVVDKAGAGVFAALNRGDFGGAIQALGSKFNSSWDNSHHWSNTINNNTTSNTSNYFFAGGQVRGRRSPYRSMANRVATI